MWPDASRGQVMGRAFPKWGIMVVLWYSTSHVCCRSIESCRVRSKRSRSSTRRSVIGGATDRGSTYEPMASAVTWRLHGPCLGLTCGHSFQRQVVYLRDWLSGERRTWLLQTDGVVTYAWAHASPCPIFPLAAPPHISQERGRSPDTKNSPNVARCGH